MAKIRKPSLGFILALIIIGLISCSILSPMPSTYSPEIAFERIRNYDFEKNNGYDGVPYGSDTVWKARMLFTQELFFLFSAGENQRYIGKGLSDENRHVRHVSVSVVGMLGLKSHGDKLLEMVQTDPDPIVRCQVAQALGQIGFTKAKDTLEKIAKEDENRNVQHRAKSALERLNQGYGVDKEQVEAYRFLDREKFDLAKVGRAAPDFELKDIFGKSWRLSDLKGKKDVVLIWIFADWCPVCHHEFHDLIKMEKEFAEADVQVFTIECHDVFRSKGIVGDRDLWWPHLVDSAGAIGAMYGVDPMEFVVHDEWVNRPSTVIVGKDGVVKFAYYGTLWGDRTSIEQTLDMIKTGEYSFKHFQRRE